MSWTVYEHWSPSGKVYVGITSQSIKVRWQNGNGYIKCKTFYRAIRKYGWENMKRRLWRGTLILRINNKDSLKL